MLQFFLRFSPFYKYKISGNSMSPTLTDGQIILINRLAYMFKKPLRGDIIALFDPRDRKVLMKRITQCVDDRYFVEGDNKNSSTDSRVFGMIEKSDVIGKVIAF